MVGWAEAALFHINGWSEGDFRLIDASPICLESPQIKAADLGIGYHIFLRSKLSPPEIFSHFVTYNTDTQPPHTPVLFRLGLLTHLSLSKPSPHFTIAISAIWHDFYDVMRHLLTIKQCTWDLAAVLLVDLTVRVSVCNPHCYREQPSS